MDTITQAAFGAALGQAFFRRQLGRRALLVGALAGTVPDLDVVIGAFGPYASWQYHRGVTHSLFFGPVAGPVFAWATLQWYRWRASRPGGERFSGLADQTAYPAWAWLWILGLITHPFLDLFTSYGTQLLAPFSDHRFSLPAMAIIDPVYTGFLGLALLAATLPPALTGLGIRVAQLMLFFTLLWQTYAWSLGDGLQRHVAQAWQAAGKPAEVQAYPTLLQPDWRRVVVRRGDEWAVAYLSARALAPVDPDGPGWTRFTSATGPAVDQVAKTREAQIFAWFAMGQVAWHAIPDGAGGTRIEAHDMRYGIPVLGPGKAMWGVAAQLDAGGQVAGPVLPFSNQRARAVASLDDLTGKAFAAPMP